MLSDLQNKFKNAVMKSQKDDFLTEIEEGGKITPSQRLHIYSHAYKARLLEVLKDDFPVLHAMVGDDIFEVVCAKYIDQYPSTHPSLRYFGQHMALFLRSHKPYNENPALIEMAEFEWAFNDVFDGVDDRRITIEDVAIIPPQAWTTLRLHLQPTFHINQFKWNTPAIWSMVTNESDQKIVPEQYPQSAPCIQWRADLVCYFRTLDLDEGPALKLAAEQRAFPEICQSLEQHGEQAPMRAAELLKVWVNEGLICQLEYLKA